MGATKEMSHRECKMSRQTPDYITLPTTREYKVNSNHLNVKWSKSAPEVNQTLPSLPPLIMDKMTFTIMGSPTTSSFLHTLFEDPSPPRNLFPHWFTMPWQRVYWDMSIVLRRKYLGDHYLPKCCQVLRCQSVANLPQTFLKLHLVAITRGQLQRLIDRDSHFSLINATNWKLFNKSCSTTADGRTYLANTSSCFQNVFETHKPQICLKHVFSLQSLLNQPSSQ